MDLKVLAKYFVHGFLYSIISLVLILLWLFLTVLLVLVGFLIGLLIGVVLLLLIIGFINGFLGDFLWNIERGEGFLSTLFHGLVLGILLLVASLVTYVLPTSVFPSLAAQVVAFVINTFVDGVIGKQVASWFGKKGEEELRQEIEPSQTTPSEALYTQAAPREISEDLPVCPLCKNRTEWKAYYRYGPLGKGYSITCSVCHAEWENIESEPMVVPQSSTPAPLNIGPTEDIFALRRLGDSVWAKAFLNKELVITNWRKLIDKFCDNCGSPLAKGEDTCPKCGTRYRSG
jgi:hypothetical protein